MPCHLQQHRWPAEGAGTLHREPHKRLAQDPEKLKGVIQQELEERWAWLLLVLTRCASRSVATCLNAKGDWCPMLNFNN